ncbi:MAG: hypothetical protein ACRDJC_03085 [Thermomicrobiales bacterium]
MLNRTRVLQAATPRRRRQTTPRPLVIVRVLGLLFLFLLPMQMRAGADDPHPHALLQLVLDARDGAIDHHDDAGQENNHDGHLHAAAEQEPDIPTVGASSGASGSMAMLAALVVLFLVPAPESRQLWPVSSQRSGRIPALDPPPPRTRPA